MIEWDGLNPHGGRWVDCQTGAWTEPSYGSDKDRYIAELRARVASLEAEIENLKGRLRPPPPSL